MLKLIMGNFILSIVLAIPLFAQTNKQATVLPMPLSPDMIEELRASGELEQVIEVWKEFNNQNAFLNYAPAPVAPITSGAGIAILVDFKDNKADTLNHPPAAYDTLLFSVGIVPTGSMKDYYIENSYGQFKFSGTTAPHPDSGRAWFRLEKSYDYWSTNHGFTHSRELAREAVKLADPYVDFGEFDNDGPDGIPNSGDDDGLIDAVYVVHAGPGYEENHCGKIWSHMSSTHYETNDNSANGGKIALSRYSVQPEEKCRGSLINMGVFAHEYGHILGLPDLYDYGYDSKGVGAWTIMAGGSWNNSGKSPAHFDAWCKSKLGWVQPIRVNNYLTNLKLPPVESNPVVYRLWTDGDSLSKQYFLVENRQKTGLFDSYLPGEGIMIYHIDDAKPNNNQQYIPEQHSGNSHYKVAVEQADGKFALEHNASSGDAGDPFPGSYRRHEFAGFLPYPTSRDYDEQDSKAAVLSIEELESDSICVDLDVGRHLPYFRFISARQSANGKPKIKPGEQGNIFVTLENIWGIGNNVELELTIDNSNITVTKSISKLGQAASGQKIDNLSDPFTISIDANASATIKTKALLKITETTTGMVQKFKFPLTFGWPGILLVSDATDTSITKTYIKVLDNIGVSYEATSSEDIKSLEDIILTNGVRDSVVIWFTGTDTSTLSKEEENLLAKFLNSGGKLIISSENLGEYRHSSQFYTNKLKAQFLKAKEKDVLLNGTAGNPITTSSEKIAVIPSSSKSKDGIKPTGNAASIFKYTNGNSGAIIVEDSVSQIIYMAFPFEALGGNPDIVLTKEILMRKFLRWFGYTLGIADEAVANVPHSVSLDITSQIISRGNAVQLQLLLAKTDNAIIAVYDGTGRRIAEKDLGLLTAGSHLLNIPTDRMSNGVYFAEVRLQDRRIATKFVLID